MAEIRNPNLQTQGSGGSGGSGGDMRSMLTLTLLALIVLFGFQYFKPNQATAPHAPQNQSQNQPQPQVPAAASAQQQLAAGPAQKPVSAPAISTPAVKAALQTDTTVENQWYKIVFTNQGAQVKHWILKGYVDTTGKPLDMVQSEAAARFGQPLSLFTYEPALTAQVNQAMYQVTASGAQPSATGLAHAPETSALTFHYAENGLDVVKTFRFDSSYVITIEAQVKRNGVPVRALVAWPAGLGDMEELASARGLNFSRVPTPSQFAWSLEGKQDSMAAPKVSSNATLDAPYEYAAITDLYFAAAFLPDTPPQATVVTLHNTIDLLSDPNDPNSQKKPAHVLGLAVGDQSGYTRLRLYAGPKQMDVLKTIHSTGADGRQDGPTLEPLIQFGWPDWLVHQPAASDLPARPVDPAPRGESESSGEMQ